jgi:hypothetical protein
VRSFVVRAAALALLVGGSLAGAPTATARTAVDLSWDAPGYEVWRHSGRLDDLAGLPKAPRAYLRARLDEIWTAAGSRTACEHSATVVVRRYAARGYLLVSREGMTAHGDDPARCTRTGHRAIYADWSGAWRRILVTGAGEDFACGELAAHDVPGTIGGATCLDGRLKTAPYDPPLLHTRPKAVVRRLTEEVNAARWDDALNWAGPDAIASMQTWQEQGYVYGGIFDGCDKLVENSFYKCSVRVRDADGNRVGSAFLTVRPPDDLRVTHAAVAIVG